MMRFDIYDSASSVLVYGPLFVFQVACYFDPNMLKVTSLNYGSAMTVLFMRLSVIVTDLVYAYGVKL